MQIAFIETALKTKIVKQTLKYCASTYAKNNIRELVSCFLVIYNNSCNLNSSKSLIYNFIFSRKIDFIIYIFAELRR
jgi:hypothetical protein